MSEKLQRSVRPAERPPTGRISRRKFIGLTAAGVAGVAGGSTMLAACGSGTQQSSTPKAKASGGFTIINFFTTEDDPNTQAVAKAAIAAFEKANAGVKINMIIISAAERDQRAITGLTVGQDIGIFEIYRPAALSLVDAGYLYPLDSLIKEIGRDQFPVGTRSVINGHDYTFPYAAGANMLWYRTDKVPSAPKSFDELKAAAARNTTGGGFGMGVPLGDTGPVGNAFPPYVWSQGADYFDPDGNVIFGSNLVRQAIQNYVDMLKYAPPGNTNWTTTTLLESYLTGRVAMSTGAGRLGFNIPSKAPQLENITGAAQGPWGPKPVNLVKISSLALDKKISNPEMAMQFIKFLLTGDYGVQYANSVPGQLLPVLKSTRDASVKAASTAYTRRHQDWLQALSDALANGNDLGGPMGASASGALKVYNGPPTPWATQAWGTNNVDVQMLQKVVVGGMSVKQGQAWAVDQYKAIVKDYKSRHPNWKPFRG